MLAGLARTMLFTTNPVVGDYIVAIFYNGAWKENQLTSSLEQARETARSVHARTGFVVQLRTLDQSILSQFGYPNSESDCDDDWEDEE